ncbi:MAG: SWIM zinc finger family protein, partial [Acidobacteriota bacterium]
MKSPVRNRGLHYFRGRRVSLLSCGPWEARAVVTGTNRYEVALTREGKRVRVSCSCPFFADRDTPCKHIWATVLAVDTKSGLRGDGRLPSALITTNAPGPEARARSGNKRPRRPRRGGAAAQAPADPALRAVAEAPPQTERTEQRARPGRTARTASQPGGRGQAAERRPGQAPVRAGELLYVIDLPLTLARGRLTMEILTRRRKRDGAPGALGRTRLTRSSIAQLRNPADREIMALLAAPADRPRPEARRYGGQGERADRGERAEVPSPCEIPEAAMPVLLPLLCSTGR